VERGGGGGLEEDKTLPIQVAGKYWRREREERLVI